MAKQHCKLRKGLDKDQNRINKETANTGKEKKEIKRENKQEK